VTAGGPGSGEWEKNLRTLKSVCARVGLPMEAQQEEGSQL